MTKRTHRRVPGVALALRYSGAPMLRQDGRLREVDCAMRSVEELRIESEHAVIARDKRRIGRLRTMSFHRDRPQSPEHVNGRCDIT